MEEIVRRRDEKAEGQATFADDLAWCVAYHTGAGGVYDAGGGRGVRRFAA
jgi:hypothetical protein